MRRAGLVLGALLCAWPLAAAEPPPPVQKLPGGITVTSRREARPHGLCQTEVTIPQLEGLKPEGAAKALNALLAATWTKADPLAGKQCAPDPEGNPPGIATVGHAVRSLRGGYLTMSVELWSFGGDAGDTMASRCRVYELATGTEVDLAGMLTPAARSRMADMVKRLLLAEAQTEKLTDADYTTDTITLDADVDLCPDDMGLVVHFDPGKIAPLELGPIEAPLPYEDVQALFPENKLTQTLLAAMP